VGNLFGTILGPIGTIFNAIFYGPIYNILMLIYNLIHATGIYGGFGLSIIALTLLVRCAMIPLTRKQLKSSRAMQELAPQINALKVQYRGDPQGLMKAQQDLYKEHGYSPISGCLPLLIQMPFLYALLFSFRTLLTENLTKINAPIYPFLHPLAAPPNPSFLWTNLSAADPWHILPFLAAFFTLIQLRMAMPVRKKAAPGAPSDPTTQATQTTMYIMPVITFIFALSFPSGLALYWTVGAMFASTQQYFLAGWGSLFLGIPGFEHLVPPPKEVPGSNLAIGGASAGRAGARSLVASSSSSSTSSSPPERSGGIRGFFRQMREMADQQAQGQEAARSGKETRSGDKNIVDAVPTKNGQLATVNGANKIDAGVSSAASQASRRARAAGRSGPVLVKPASNADLPEKAIQRDATAPLDGVATGPNKGSNPLPEVAISAAGKGNGSGASDSTSSSSSATSSSSSTTAARPALGTKSGSTAAGNASHNGSSGNGTRRPTAGNGKGPSSSASSSRNRSSNRSKGGR
jgi:YidC/Oxa1 family membrane protein insertase